MSSLLLLIGGSLGMTDRGRWWALIGLYAFTASYSTSLGALVWVLVSEVRCSMCVWVALLLLLTVCCAMFGGDAVAGCGCRCCW